MDISCLLPGSKYSSSYARERLKVASRAKKPARDPLKKLSLSGEKFICHFSTNTGSILSLLLRKEPDIYTSIIGAHYRQETEPDLGFFLMRSRRIQIVLDRLTPERHGLGNRSPGVRVLGEKAAPARGVPGTQRVPGPPAARARG